MIKYIFIFTIFFNSAFCVELVGDFKQGSMILGKTNPNSKVKIDKKNVKVSKEGYFVFGISRERKNNVILRIFEDEKVKIIEKKVFKRKYKIQRIDGLPSKQVTPPPEVYDSFKEKFIYPLDKYIITGVYGSQRILNGKPRSPHYGIDFHAPEGTPVKAMLDGEVTLVENDMYFTGGTIIFDHGHGISTLYMHMKDIKVSEGQKIKKGQIVGTLGKSGRATGPHLDIRLNWFDIKLDPQSVLRKN